ncbi:MAG TPA: putative lipid II flippase FtsW [Megamonas hypermegale]|uniref:Probable peptidoglycan glycosyltransferase FtsW n=1 Tax=Megamonas hypermegale TaxID=158847 RepID=A0A921HP11_9FIRM|nr:putative lipid II flippase FtsW [Megamonas hypermegale]HJF84790.1 putative lipid II flippase FtsW [Megamonas hypermegale]
MKIQRKFWINDMEALTYIMFILIIIGTINICSASLITAYTDFENPYYFLTRHIISIVVGFIAFFLSSRFNYKRLSSARWEIFLIVITLVLLGLVLLVGITVNGSRRWLPLGFMQFQPSELAKIVTIVISSSYLGKCLDKKLPITVDPRKNIIFLICIAIAGLVELQPDMGTAMIILGIPTMLYFIAGLDKKWIGIICGLGAIVLAFLATFQPYRLDRIRSWFDPWSRSQDDGYQIVQSILAIGSGEFSGMGLGHGFSKYSYLPESHTDFAFAVFCQEMGFIGALVIFLLLIAMAFYFIKIALRTQDNFGKMLVCGIMLLIVGQAAGNIAMVIGLLPVIGFPLPFISYGGTSLILNMTCMGLVISVDRHNRKSASAQPVSSRTGRYSKNR